MNFLFSVLAFAVILIPAIIIHELGHFLAAKMVGINILEFGIGFPPRIKRLFIWGETEFTLNWLPLGGFVRPLGEDMIGPVQEDYPEVDFTDETDKAKHNSYITEREELMQRGVPREKLLSVNEAKPLPRIWFMVAGAVANVVSAVLFFIIAALFGLPIVQGASLGLAVLPENTALSQANVQQWDAIELVNGEYFASQAAFFNLWQNATEPIELTMRHPNDFEPSELAGTRYTITVNPAREMNIAAAVLVTAIVENSPAEEAGLLPNDLVFAANGVPFSVENPNKSFVDITEEFVGRDLPLSVLRNGEEITLHLIPRENPPRGEGRIGIQIMATWRSNEGVVFFNADPQVEYIPQPLDAAIQYSFAKTLSVLKAIWDLPGQLVSGALSPEQARPVSIVGISQIGGKYLQDNLRSRSIWMILDFIGLISIFLGITQLLPIPPLDGARVVFVLIEMLRGKPVSPRIEGLINQVGLVIMLILGAIVILMDIFMPLV
jgi:regulator of sigma E protease